MICEKNIITIEHPETNADIVSLFGYLHSIISGTDKALPTFDTAD